MRSIWLLLSWIALASLSGPASAQVDCEYYASNAVKSAMEVRELRCEYDLDHPEWSLDRDGHLRWCRGATEESVMRESGHRDSFLKICRRCSGYADQAVQMLQRSNSYDANCGFGGPEWSSNRSDHFRFCVAARQETAEATAAHRTERLGRCTYCKKYADEAYSQVRARESMCDSKRSGANWSPHRSDHWSWCMRLDDIMQTFRETKARQASLEACAYGGVRTRSVGQPLTVEPSTSESKSWEAKPKPSGTPTPLQRGVSSRSKKLERGSQNTSSETSTVKPCQPGQVNDPCKNKSRALSPGLLEGSGGIARQGGPSATGTAAGGGGGGAPIGLGDSFRVR